MPAEVRRKSLPEPNIDFAVATLTWVAVVAVARTADWIARPRGLRRRRSRYVPALSAPARLRSSTCDAAAVCYRFVI